MRRTQISLTSEQWHDLHLIGEQEGVSVAELIRRAVDKTYRSKTDKQSFRAALEGIAGLWKDREDIGDIEEYVRAGRKDTRAKRLGLR